MVKPFVRKYGNNQADQTWTYGEQPVPRPWVSQAWGYAKFGATLAGLYRLGQREWRPGKRGWDYLITASRYLEEYSPGRILRTFQISHMLSPFEAAARIDRYYTPDIIRQIEDTPGGKVWLEDLSRRVGKDVTRLEYADPITGLSERAGFRFEKGQLLLGVSEDTVLLKHAGLMRAPTGARPAVQAGIVRSQAGSPVEGLSRALSAKIPYRTLEGELLQEAHLITGGQSRLQALGRATSGWGTYAIERLNQLARAPAELPGVSEVFDQIKRIPGLRNLHLDVKSSSGLKTLGKLTAKLGLVGGAAWLAYKELDYHVRKSSLFDNTILSEGITAGAATLWAKGQLGLSKAAEVLGLHNYRERQEEIAPGSTSIQKLLTAPIIGALGGLGIGYGGRIWRQGFLQKSGLSLAQASLASGAEDEFFRSAIYGRVVNPEIRSVLNENSIRLVQEQAEKRIAGWEGKIARRIASTQTKRTTLGALSRVLGEVSPSRLKWLVGGALGLATVAPFIPGALIPSDRPEELEALYSGKKKVAVRKGAHWEMGRSKWEGGAIDRFEEHWYPRLLARAKEKAIWGENPPSPLQQWYLKNFTYELERRHYSDRPYPITGAAFEEIPFIGPLLSTTIGRLFKPPVLMHEEEYKRTGESGREEYLQMPPKYGETVAPGELQRGAPISPYGIKGTVSEEVYRAWEAVGLPGFVLSSIHEKITGTQGVFVQEERLESAGRITSTEREFYEGPIAGGLGTTELYRRLFPHRQRSVPLYNPIPNTMPSWLPGAGERSPNFRVGDPYVAIPRGEERLPGPGFAALHPELEGVAPEDYPAFWRHQILADIAPYSDEYRKSFAGVQAAMNRNELTEEQVESFHETLRQVAARKQKKEFSDYLYSEKHRTPIQQMLADINEREKEQPGRFERAIGTYWETLGHNIETPLESLTPVSPGAKLMHMRTAVEDYEKTQVFGTQNAFWDHPIRDFFAPTLYGTLHSLGSDKIPSGVQEKRELEDYFDVLKYIKASRLRRAAQMRGDEAVATEMEEIRRETLFGLNPFTYNFTQIMRALPRRDRDYFNEFAEADMEERAKIINLVPENEQALMVARWKLRDAQDIQKAIKKGLLNENQVKRAETVLEQLWEEKSAEGFPKDKTLWVEYLSTRLQGESYGDWYRRTKLLEEKLEGKSLPGPDWVGWSPMVDLEDIKLKVVQNLGASPMDYDLWPERIRAVARRPIVEEAAKELNQSKALEQEDLRKRIDDILSAHGVVRSDIHMVPISDGGTTLDINISEDRFESDKDLIRRRLNG